MRKWQVVKGMTPKQKGEVLERVCESGQFQLTRQDNGEYGFLREGGSISDWKLLRCPLCGRIEILYHGQMDVTFCQECGKSSKIS